MANLLSVDPSFTLDELEAARAVSTNPFPEVDAQDDIEDIARGLTAVVPQTPAEAITNARSLSQDNANVGVGMCLGCVRGREFVIPALWPDAETAWEQAKLKHRQTDATQIPRGAVAYYTNDRHGHIVLSIGGGFCWTTDYHRPGFVDAAWMPNLEPWCGGTLVGWAEVLNGIDVWPNPKKPKPKPPPYGLADKERFLAAALKRAKRNHASQRRIDGLTRWHDHVEQRLKETA